jgi:hypothetical protein
MKVIVAIMERLESRLIQQIPCQLVHLEPIRVPKPTNNPATIIISGLALSSIFGGCTMQ